MAATTDRRDALLSALVRSLAGPKQGQFGFQPFGNPSFFSNQVFHPFTKPDPIVQISDNRSGNGTIPEGSLSEDLNNGTDYGGFGSLEELKTELRRVKRINEQLKKQRDEAQQREYEYRELAEQQQQQIEEYSEEKIQAKEFQKKLYKIAEEEKRSNLHSAFLQWQNLALKSQLLAIPPTLHIPTNQTSSPSLAISPARPSGNRSAKFSEEQNIIPSAKPKSTGLLAFGEIKKRVSMMAKFSSRFGNAIEDEDEEDQDGYDDEEEKQSGHHQNGHHNNNSHHERKVSASTAASTQRKSASRNTTHLDFDEEEEEEEEQQQQQQQPQLLEEEEEEEEQAEIEPEKPPVTFESYLESLDAPPPLLSPIRSNIVVCLRCRPLSKREFEEKHSDIVRCIDGKTITVEVRKATGADLDYLAAKRVLDKSFTFDRVYVGSKCTQEDVFNGVVSNVVESVVEGENATVFAYGATGSGKTYTMLGTPENPGVIVLTMQKIFEELKNCKGASLEVSFLEVYCELIKDLLAPHSENQKPLEVRETKEGVVIPGLSSLPAKSAEEVMAKLHSGNTKRTVRATNSNEVSSRSHAVFQVKIKRKFTTGVKVGTLSMIDLAGSERLKKSEVDGLGATEATRINQSLLSLGNCITKLASGGAGAHVPYRDSKLTRLLQQSLQGHCRTIMIANISPSDHQVEETLNTLKYADRAKSIQTVVKKKASVL